MSRLPIALAVFANDEQNPLKLLTAERQEILKSFQEEEARGNDFLRIEHEPNILLDTLTNKIKDFNERIIILHYGGHANSNKLFLEDGAGHAIGLATLLKAQAKNLKLVVLNGCATHEQADLLLQHGATKAIIATSSSIEDSRAKEFAVVFFKQLARKNSIRTAFQTAIGAIQFKSGETFNTDPQIVKRGLGTEQVNEEIAWGLYVNEDNQDLLEDPYWYTITDLTLTNAVQNKSNGFKMFFIYEPQDGLASTYFEQIKANIELLDSDQFINGTKSELTDSAIETEIDNADIVFIILTGLPTFLTTFWKQRKITPEILQGKSIVYIHVKSSSPLILDTLAEKIKNRPFYQIPFNQPPPMFNIEGVGGMNSLAHILKTDIFENILPKLSENLPNCLSGLDLTIQEAQFTLFDNDLQAKNITLLLIDGHEKSGQVLLVNRLLKKKKLDGNSYKISFLFQEQQNNAITDLLKTIEDRIDPEKKLPGDVYAKILHCLQQHDILLFIRGLTPNFAQQILKPFWVSLSTVIDSVNVSLSKRLLIFAISHSQDGNNPTFLKSDFMDTVQCRALVITPISQFEDEHWTNWLDENKALIKAEHRPKVLPDYLENVFIETGTNLKVPKQFLTKLISLDT